MAIKEQLKQAVTELAQPLLTELTACSHCHIKHYTDIYKAIIKYIDTNLRNTEYILSFGIEAIATQSPRASMKFCLKNNHTNKQKRWTLLLTGKTILALEANVRASVAVQLGKY